ncbi:hypothetical protein ACVD4U_004279 [Vibrio vulnificus]|uniref:hypothetical protein n=1 Tax=Vibrio TaxID=662 RepID=UPI0011218E75|nr:MULTISPECIES: hypothetical protein [Vibrio]EJE8516349.1 hypothetical protein [Vibrio parahaemolyticus]EJE8775144.1 hypothetical protein [Vibrio parahaemolyticus]MBN8035078.1 hypothetical protein [Vibrio vulnificus]MDS1868851.1 hypothetical protein [Vibrio parahaemolyticus]TOJ04939.1 hypothetical protein CGI46_23540 [Vibrio parahaemolyticus]
MKNILGLGSFVLGILSTVIISMGSSGFLGDIGDKLTDWGDVKHAYSSMQNESRNDNRYGSVRKNEPGFEVLASVIAQNVPSIDSRRLAHIVLVTPSVIGGVADSKVQIAYRGELDTYAVADYAVFQYWVSQSKSQYFLYIGLKFLFLSFVIGLIHYLMRED